MDNNQQDELVFGDTITTDIFGDKVEVVETVDKKPEDIDKEKVDNKKDVETPNGDETDEVKKDTDEDLFDIFGDDVSTKDNNSKEKETVSDSNKKEENIDKGDDGVDYNVLAQVFIDSGEWEDFKLEDGRKFVDLVSNGEIDESTFSEIKKQQDDWRAEKIKEDALGSLSDAEKQYLEYVKNGGNLQEFVKTYTLKERATEIDIKSDMGKKSAIYSYYKNMHDWDDNAIQKHIKRLEESMDLDEHAEMAKSKLEAVTAKNHEELVKQQAESARLRQEAEKKYIDTLKESLKSEKFTTKQTNSILKDFTERDERGFTEIDKRFLELRNNPEQTSFLWNVLMNTEDFIKNSTQKRVNEEKLKTFKILKFNKNSKKSKRVDNEKSTDEVEFG